MKTFYKIENGKTVLGSGKQVPSGFTEYKEGKEPEEVLQELDAIKAGLQDRTDEKRIAYQSEADPLYFKWKRGEATENDWLNKVAEIDERFY